jgi:hypothetical protein
MTEALIKKVHTGYQVDGLDLIMSNCGCGGLTGPAGYGVGDCCLTYSTVKQVNHTVAFFAKATIPNRQLRVGLPGQEGPGGSGRPGVRHQKSQEFRIRGRISPVSGGMAEAGLEGTLPI